MRYLAAPIAVMIPVQASALGCMCRGMMDAYLQTDENKI